MKKPEDALTRQETEIWIGNILRIGVLLSASLALLGGVLFLSRQGFSLPEYAAFKGEPARLRGLSQILQTALMFHPRSIIQLGILFLIATPMARVVFSVFVFIRQKDWLYVWVTLIVFLLLLFSLIYGR